MGKREYARMRRLRGRACLDEIERMGVEVAMRMAQAGIASFPYLPSRARRRKGLPHWARMRLRGKT